MACRDVLLGTNAGMLFDFSIESSDKKERKVNRVLDLGDVREPIKGLQQLPLPGNRLMVLASTPSRLYAFTGSTPVQTLFAGYPDPAGESPVVQFANNKVTFSGVWCPTGMLALQESAAVQIILTWMIHQVTCILSAELSMAFS